MLCSSFMISKCWDGIGFMYKDFTEVQKFYFTATCWSGEGVENHFHIWRVKVKIKVKFTL
jgi:hypothetical protein